MNNNMLLLALIGIVVLLMAFLLWPKSQALVPYPPGPKTVKETPHVVTNPPVVVMPPVISPNPNVVVPPPLMPYPDPNLAVVTTEPLIPWPPSQIQETSALLPYPMDSGKIIILPTGKYVEYNGLRIPYVAESDLNPATVIPLVWRASEIKPNCVGPEDAKKNQWYEDHFDDSPWETVKMPDVWEGNNSDRFYRGYVYLDVPQEKLQQRWNFLFNFYHDNSWRIYVNEKLMRYNVFGYDANSLFSCHDGNWYGQRTGWIGDFMRPGLNIISVQISNGAGPGQLNAQMTVDRR